MVQVERSISEEARPIRLITANRTLILRDWFKKVLCAVYTERGPLEHAEQPMVVYELNVHNKPFDINQRSGPAVLALKKARQLLVQGQPDRRALSVVTPATIAGVEFVLRHTVRNVTYGVYTQRGPLTSVHQQLVVYELDGSGVPTKVDQGSPAALTVLLHAGRMLHDSEHDDPVNNEEIQATSVVAHRTRPGPRRRRKHKARVR